MAGRTVSHGRRSGHAGVLGGLPVRLSAVLVTGVHAANAQGDNRREAGQRLLRQRKFAAAGAEFAAALKAVKSWNTKSARLAVDGGVTCALTQKKWDAALELVEKFRRERTRRPGPPMTSRKC